MIEGTKVTSNYDEERKRLKEEQERREAEEAEEEAFEAQGNDEDDKVMIKRD